MTPAQARHREILDGLGLTPEDWARVKALAMECTPLYTPAALADLSQPIRVGACLLEARGYSSGWQVGTYQGRAILVWRMKESEVAAWRRLKRGQQKAPPA